MGAKRSSGREVARRRRGALERLEVLHQNIKDGKIVTFDGKKVYSPPDIRRIEGEIATLRQRLGIAA